MNAARWIMAARPGRAGAALCVLALAMSGCGKAPSPLATPEPDGPPLGTPTAGASSPDTSVPDAASVLTPGTAPAASQAAGRTNDTLTRAQESGAMPMPGQNNDHSAPTAAAKPASAAPSAPPPRP